MTFREMTSFRLVENTAPKRTSANPKWATGDPQAPHEARPKARK